MQFPARIKCATLAWWGLDRALLGKEKEEEMTKAEDIVKDEDYQFGFHDNVEPKFSTGRGLTEEVVRQISAEKHEPKWMLDYRLKAFHIYEKCQCQILVPIFQGLI